MLYSQSFHVKDKSFNLTIILVKKSHTISKTLKCICIEIFGIFLLANMKDG